MTPEESTTPDLVELLHRALEAANRRDFDAMTTSTAQTVTTLLPALCLDIALPCSPLT
jgi:hypothetical protein